VSPPADLQPLPNKNNLLFCDQSKKIAPRTMHIQSEKQKSSVYVATRGKALLW